MELTMQRPSIRLGSGLSSVAAKPVWNLRAAAPALYERLIAQDRDVAPLCAFMDERVPFQKSWGFGTFDGFVRPDRHVRAFYLGCEPGGGYVAIKGTEVFCENFDKMIDRLSRMWNIYVWGLGGITRQILKDFGAINALERFPVLEGKLPAVHATWDAQEEADCALAVQARHVETYGGFARMPIPLFVYSWGPEVERKISAQLLPHMSPKAKRIVESGIKEGLGGYVYYYPAVPARLMHVQAPNVGASFSLHDRVQALRKSGVDPKTTIASWIEIVARLLALGFVATDPANLNRGYCLQPQNMVTDGGIVDLNSVRAIDTFKNDGEAFIAVTRTLQALTQAVSWLMVGTDAGADTFAERFTEIYGYVSSEVWRQVAQAADANIAVPALVARMARQPDVYARVSDAFAAFYDSCEEYKPEEREKHAYRQA